MRATELAGVDAGIVDLGPMGGESAVERPRIDSFSGIAVTSSKMNGPPKLLL